MPVPLHEHRPDKRELGPDVDDRGGEAGDVAVCGLRDFVRGERTAQRRGGADGARFVPGVADVVWRGGEGRRAGKGKEIGKGEGGQHAGRLRGVETGSDGLDSELGYTCWLLSYSASCS